MPYDKKQKADWQRRKHREMRAQGYKLAWVKQTPPQYDTTIPRLQFRKKANSMKKPIWRRKQG